MVEQWDTHVVAINKVIPPNWKVKFTWPLYKYNVVYLDFDCAYFVSDEFPFFAFLIKYENLKPY